MRERQKEREINVCVCVRACVCACSRAYVLACMYACVRADAKGTEAGAALLLGLSLIGVFLMAGQTPQAAAAALTLGPRTSSCTMPPKGPWK